ncbi:PREDICTED: uncharacterized protein LOC109483328 [Branchiostoma belcheri]|uniref:Uncharacterized protein LOC109483328 n=1 Tax=Branchiostoma belcheri TaxID=7741 RepID=A0A6P5AIV1_BRABE|nr:PREDICTED: uncharacterized protein LOC109483328 [Branchiostoma belcheri]
MALQQEFQCSRCRMTLPSHELRDECPSAVRRHWGRYDYRPNTWDVQREWSCCLEEREDAPGCRRDAHDVIAPVQGLKIQTSVQDVAQSLLKSRPSPILNTSTSSTPDQSISPFPTTKEQQQGRRSTDLDEKDNLLRQNLQTETVRNGDKVLVRSVARKPFLYVPMYLPEEITEETTKFCSRDDPLERGPMPTEFDNSERLTDTNATTSFVTHSKNQGTDSCEKHTDCDEERGSFSQNFKYGSAALEKANLGEKDESEQSTAAASFSSESRSQNRGAHTDNLPQKDQVSADQQARSRVVDLYQEWLDKLRLESPPSSSPLTATKSPPRRLKNIRKDRRSQSDDNLSTRSKARSHSSLPRQQPHRLAECRSLFSSAVDLTSCLRSSEQGEKSVDKWLANSRSSQQSGREEHMIQFETERTSHAKTMLMSGENDGVDRGQKMSDLTGMRRWIRPTYTSLFPTSNSRLSSVSAPKSDKSQNCRKKSTLPLASSTPFGYSAIMDDVATNDRFTKYTPEATRVRASSGNPVPGCSSRIRARTTTEHPPVVVNIHLTTQPFPTFLAHHPNSPAA